MAAEFYINFKDRAWYAAQRPSVERRLEKLKTFAQRQGNEFRLLGHEGAGKEGRWTYDVRLFFLDDARILMEISTRPPSVEADLVSFLASLRRETDIAVVDEDGESPGW